MKELDASVVKTLRAYNSKNLAFMREVIYITQSCDDECVMWLALGIPMLGMAPPARGLMDRVQPPDATIGEWMADTHSRNLSLLPRLGPSGDETLDTVAYEKSMEEVTAGVLDGPYDDLDDVPLELPCLVPRHGIWEQHGDAEEPSVRIIDDLLMGEQNTTTGTLSSHRPTDVDGLVAQARVVATAFRTKLNVWKSDFSKAFKQIPGDPSQRGRIVIGQWSPCRGRTVFFVASSQLFGSKGAPLNFSRFPAACCQWMACLFAVAMSHCVDDVISLERALTAASGRDCWLRFAELCGWKISREKSPPPCDHMPVIGVMLDLRSLPDGNAFVAVTKKRLQALEASIRSVLLSNTLGSGYAAALAGKLSFTITAAFGRLVRARIRPIIRRAYSNVKRLGFQLVACLSWWLRFLRTYDVRPIPSNLQGIPTVISYSDGEGRDAGVGAAVWVPWLQHPLAAFTHVPPEIRELWSYHTGSEGGRDIFMIEAVGPLLLLLAFPRIFRSVLWIHFIDNTAAEASLISGSSSLDVADHIVGLTWEKCCKRRVWPYFDRVSSKSNPVDLLSRGDKRGPWRGVKEVAFPIDEIEDLASECGGWLCIQNIVGD